MHSNQPLQDVDRWDWLGRLKEAAVEKLLEGYPGVVVTCSALKKKYRDVLRMAVDGHQNFRVHFVYLHANKVCLVVLDSHLLFVRIDFHALNDEPVLINVIFPGLVNTAGEG